MGTPVPSVRRNIGCEAGSYGARRAAGARTVTKRDAPWGGRLPRSADRGGRCGQPQLGRNSGKHTRRRTVRSPNAVAATGVRGLPVRGFVTKAGPWICYIFLNSSQRDSPASLNSTGLM